MKERSINIKAWEVRAILDGRKTQTRRVVKPQPERRWNVEPDGTFCRGEHEKGEPCEEHAERLICPYGQPGDRLWVRETPLNHALSGYSPVWFYRADDDEKPHDRKWIPSILMPRKASRITLEIESVRVERLNEISEEDAKAEGIDGWNWDGDVLPFVAANQHLHPAVLKYALLWQSINGPGSWDANPWVWVVTFRRV